MSFEEALSKVKELEGGDAIAESLLATHQSEISSRNGEAKDYRLKLRQAQNDLESLAKYKKAVLDLGYDPEVDVLEDKIEALKGNGKKLTKMDELETAVKRLTRQVSEAEAEKQVLKQAKNEEQLTKSLTKLFAAESGKGYTHNGVPFMVRSIIKDGEAKVNDAGTQVWVRDGVEVDLAEGFDSYLSRPEVKAEKIVNQVNGSQTSGITPVDNKKEISRAEFDSLPLHEKHEALKTRRLV